MSDLISRADAIDAVVSWTVEDRPHEVMPTDLVDRIKALPSADAEFTDLPDIPRYYYEKVVGKMAHEINILKEQLESAEAVEWIPCSERLPEDIRPVLVTWKNTDPASYYQYIVGKHFIGTAHYCKGRWHWYSSVTEDLLAEYGKCDSEEFDEAIEVVAWMPLPKPYREDGEV